MYVYASPQQLGCKGPLYRFYRALVLLASNPLFDLLIFVDPVDPWTRGRVDGVAF